MLFLICFMTVLARGQQIIKREAVALPFVGYAPPSVCQNVPALGESMSSMVGVASGSDLSQIVSSLSSSLPQPTLDLRVLVSAGDRQVIEKRSTVVEMHRAGSKRRCVDGVQSHIHRVSVNFNLVRREDEVDDSHDYICPHCGCSIAGSKELRKHLSEIHVQIHR